MTSFLLQYSILLGLLTHIHTILAILSIASWWWWSFLRIHGKKGKCLWTSILDWGGAYGLYIFLFKTSFYCSSFSTTKPIACAFVFFLFLNQVEENQRNNNGHLPNIQFFDFIVSEIFGMYERNRNVRIEKNFKIN